MPSFDPSNDTDAERRPLLERRSRPNMDVNVSHPSLERNISYLRAIEAAQSSPGRSSTPKLSVDIPSPLGRPARFVTSIPGNHETALQPILENGVVHSGSFTSSPYRSARECSEDWIYTLQSSGNCGFNDYLHWYTTHPDHYPCQEQDYCACVQYEDYRRELNMYIAEIEALLMYEYPRCALEQEVERIVQTYPRPAKIAATYQIVHAFGQQAAEDPEMQRAMQPRVGEGRGLAEFATTCREVGLFMASVAVGLSATYLIVSWADAQV